MNKDNLFIGMTFKTSQDPSLYGTCTDITESHFIFFWNFYDNVKLNKPVVVKASLEAVLECFNYYGWEELSSLEKELL